MTPMRPNTRSGAIDYDAVSNTSGAYVGKRSAYRQRQMSAQSKTIRLAGNARTYYPEGYYKRVGYQKSETSSNARVDALGQRVRDRFNEELGTESEKRQSGGLHHRTLKQLKQAHKAQGPASQTRGSDIFSMNKRRSEVAMSQAKEEDDQSTITADRLKRFNDVQGTVAGTQLDEIAAREAEAADAEAMELLDGEDAQVLGEEEKDEVASQMK